MLRTIERRRRVEEEAMTEQTEGTNQPSGAAPVRITLEDVIAAGPRGVARAMAAEQAEVSGYAQLSGSFTPNFGQILGRPPIIVGFVAPTPSGPAGPVGGVEVPIRR